MLADSPVLRDQRRISVGFGLRDDHQIERVSRPRFKQRRFREVGEGVIADFDSQLCTQLLCQIQRRSDNPACLLQILQFDQNSGRDQKIVFVDGIERPLAQVFNLVFT